MKEEKVAITLKRNNKLILRIELLVLNKETVNKKTIKVNELNKPKHRDKTKRPQTKIDMKKIINAIKLTIDLIKTIGLKDHNHTKAEGQKTIPMFITLKVAKDVGEISRGRNTIIVNTKTQHLTEAKEMLLEELLEAALLLISIMKSERKVNSPLEPEHLTKNIKELSQFKTNIMTHNTKDREDLITTMKSKTLLFLIFNSD